MSCDHRAVARDDEDLADLLGEARLDLDDAAVVRVRGSRRALEELALLDARHVEGDVVELVAPGKLDRPGHRDGGRRPAPARDLRGGLGGALHRVPVEPLDVGVPGRVPLLNPHAEAHRDAARRALQDPVVEYESAGGAVLEEEVGVVPAARQGDGEQLLGEHRVDRRRPA